MTAQEGSRGSEGLSPDDAFAVLGDKTRLGILQTLGEADKPLSFSELYDRVEYDTTANFSYHLDKLMDHFVEETDDGYTLRRPGERVVEAILSGAITTDPVRQMTETDKPCPFCSAPIEVGYQHERVTMHCPECSGFLGNTDSGDGQSSELGNLGFRPLPPAGVESRTAEEIHDVSKIWTATTMHAVGRGVCPRCSGAVDRSINVCETHDASDGVCDQCGLRFGAMASATCLNCIFSMQAAVPAHMGTHPEFMAFMLEHGIDPIALENFHPYTAVDEVILSHHPFKARYTYTVDSDTLSLTVDEDLSVVSVTEGQTPESK